MRLICWTTACTIALTVMSAVPVRAADGESNTPEVQRLSDIGAIRKLLAHHANSVDNRRWDAWRDEVFAPDGVLDVPDNEGKRTVTKGAQAIIDYVRPRLGETPGGSHSTTNGQIEITSPTTAKATWRLGTASSYQSTFVKHNGQWRIQFLKLIREPGASPTAQSRAQGAPANR